MNTRLSLCTHLLLVTGLVTGCSGDASDWASVAPPTDAAPMLDVWAFSETEAWFVNDSSDVHVYEGGSWSTRSTEARRLSCLFALSQDQVWLCAGDQVLFYNGASFAQLGDLSPMRVTRPIDIWASSASDVWVVGEDGVAGHHNGTDWEASVIPSSGNSSVWGSGPDDVYALGRSSLSHFDGTSWSEVEPGDDVRIRGGEGQVWGTSASDVWVVTDSVEHYYFDGQRWRVVEIDDRFVGDLATVWGASSGDLWAAGTAGALARNEGDGWEQVDHQRIGAPYLQQFFAMHGSAADNIWVVGHQLGEGGATPLIRRYRP